MDLKEILNRKIKNIVILTGAGISAESGIPTFRDQNGLWENHAIEDVATPEAFLRNPKLVHQFYNQRRKQLQDESISPNPAHLALAKLEKGFKGSVQIITQNIDNLHERAGSKNIWHMHGELLKIRCTRTSEVFDHITDINFDSICQCCGVKAQLRPHIVWFGEMPFYMDEIQETLMQSDLFLSIGTSGQVYPAANFIQMISPNALSLEINIDQTQIGQCFDHSIIENSSESVPLIVEYLLKTFS